MILINYKFIKWGSEPHHTTNYNVVVKLKNKNMPEIIAYCMKTKKKETMVNAVIEKTKNNGYMAKGETAEGNKMCAMMSKETADAAVKSGHAVMA